MTNGATGDLSGLTVLCAGDRFITPEAFTDRLHEVHGDDLTVVETRSDWPDVPFGAVDGVREAAGDPGELAELAAGADVLLTHLAPVTASVLESATRLRVVGVTRGGPVNVDLDAATRCGVPVLYLPGRNLGAVAEFTVGVMIGLPRSIATSARSMAAGRWDASYFRFERTGPELSACTVGLIGTGAVGLRVADLLAAFGARVLGHDPYADPEVLAAHGIEPATLDDLLAASDIVSLHARLTEQTRHLLDTRALALMRPDAYVINTARGELVDQPALRRALEAGQLQGAALDVFDPEPPDVDDPMLRHPQVLATPHLAGASRQVALLSAERIVDSVTAYLRDGTLEHCANPDHQRL